MRRTPNPFPALSILCGALCLAGCIDDNSRATQVEAPAPATATPTAPNQAPRISGSPPSAVKAGENYDFTPSASDPDGDALSFSVQNKPAWLAFDSTTGRLSGMPGEMDIGSFTGIEIVVSDGRSSAALGPFSVDVTQIALGSITLSWTAPATNTDGSPLTNLAGYRIYYGKSTTLDQVIRLDSPGITTYVIEDLSPAKYYVAMSAVNSDGVESERSQVLSKTIG